jgi:hypothetical protein
MNTFLWLPWQNRFYFVLQLVLPFPTITFSYQGNSVTDKINIYERTTEHYYKAMKTVKFIHSKIINHLCQNQNQHQNTNSIL